ncbi:hypothetical protein ScPMuIL_016796 [Solemya velum]
MAVSMFTLAVIVSALVLSTSAQPENEVSLREMQQVLQVSMVEMFQSDLQDNMTGNCACSGVSCGCCAHLKIPKIKFGKNCCANVTFLPKSIGFKLTFSIDNKVIYSKEISAKNPPPLCVKIPKMKMASICIVFYNLAIHGKGVNGCMRLEAKLGKSTVKKLDLGCFKIPGVENDDDMQAVPGVENDDDMQAVSSSTSTESMFPQSDMIEELREVLQEALADTYGSEVDQNVKSSCHCSGSACGCCVRVHIKKVGLNSMCCANITYLSNEIGFQFSFSVDGKVIFKDKVSAKNPPPLCLKIPGLKKLASACVIFYDLSVSGKKFSGCIRLEVKLMKVKVAKVQLGCFKIPPNAGIVETNETGGGLSVLLSKGRQSVKSYERVVFN